MRYVGGKNRLWKHLLPIMLDGVEPTIRWVEPFVGSGGVICRVPSTHPRLGSDTNPYLIALLEYVRDGGELPSDVSEEAWRHLRAKAKRLDPDTVPHDNKALIAFAGFGCSYAARWFEGYARDKSGKTNFADNARRSLLGMVQGLEGVVFTCADYRELALPESPAIIYCDPPYAGSVKNYYPFSGEFDHKEFWYWALEQATCGYTVYVSSFECPLKTPQIVWEQNRAVSLTKNTGKRWRADRLYKVG